ncbi:glycerol-3-phosphate 1-O-acyltransferase, partial [Micromonospora sp. WMMD736]|uniref:glycerol-3-phosphate 1-O-acyltransferase n=1 Tax=Micromonospora sp. WMMD736 TaxID=3404112 RepID=UPI003B94EBEE
RRFEQRTGGADSLAAFVRRQAELALGRAERAAVTGRYKLPRLVPQEVRASRSFAAGAKQLAERTGRRPQQIAELSSAYLQEMAAAHSRLAIDSFERFGRMLMRAYTLEVDEDRLAGLRELNRRHSLVFLPNHRSYLDPFVVRSTLLSHGFPANHCFAGNNMAWWPMGDWVRRTGNIVLRRSIGDDPVYKFVLREYLGYLMLKRLNLEWYIEGGRTRTGKLRPPKFGLLTYLVDAFDQLDESADAYLVPMSILYDGLPEVSSLTAEQRGGAKKPESITWLLNYPRSTGRGFGRVHVGIGEPLSLRQALGPGEEGNGEARRHRVEKVAFEVCHRINQATPVTATALVTLALLGVDDRALTLSEIEAIVAPFLCYFDRRELPVTGGLRTAGELRHVLDWLTEEGVVVRFDGGLVPVWGISPDRHLDAAFYRNSIVHMLVNRAIVELVLAAVADGRITRESEAWDEALRLRDLLKFEFFFPDKAEFRHNLEIELTLIEADWASKLSEPGSAKHILASARPHLAHRALHSFIEAYFVTADRLAVHPPAKPIDENTFVTECLGFARQRRMQRRLRSSDSISTEVFRTALKVAAHRGLLGPGGEELARRRREFAAELAELLGRLESMRDLAASDGLDSAGPEEFR